MLTLIYKLLATLLSSRLSPVCTTLMSATDGLHLGKVNIGEDFVSMDDSGESYKTQHTYTSATTGLREGIRLCRAPIHFGCARENWTRGTISPPSQGAPYRGNVEGSH